MIQLGMQRLQFHCGAVLAFPSLCFSLLLDWPAALF